MKGLIFDIARSSLVDGDGVRTTLFFKGCNLRCKWCHNPEGLDAKAQILFYKDRCVSCGKCKDVCQKDGKECTLCGKCALACPNDAKEICGREYTAEELLSIILRDIDVYELSDGGVTFTGGECMLQIDFLEEILKACKENGIHTAIDTAGHVPFERFERIIPYTNLFLYDVKCYDSDMHKQYTGVGNDLILENLRRLLAAGKSIWVRIPVIASVNDSAKEMQRIKDFLCSCGMPEKIELLPYHAMGEHKYTAIGKKAPYFSVPSEEKMKDLKRIFL